eukprot:CAMPEP_0181343814 /NCGR_PEP_ID=MMETSP1101-20121128/31809_1 /TAXON_ID=46948 /ORGANISM="Rhodomonas abbreviata, Strain Caron Lab Isolate" /LENGTH=68 /DNA_ID=CAMNT_0023455513 /DNA_START=358 /DNA_END=564 /DNA_ORIENTATION=+
MLTSLVFDRAVGNQLTQTFPWGTSSGEDYGTAGEGFDGDGTGPNKPYEANHPYSAVRQRNYGSLSSFH